MEKRMLSIFLDMETTGLDPGRHVPLDIAFRVLDMTDGSQKGEYSALIRPSAEEWEKSDPSSMRIHGLTWEQLEKGKKIEQVTEEVIALFQQLGIRRERAVFICQNPSFDRSFFAQIVDIYQQQQFDWPYHWLDFASMFWGIIARKAYEGHVAFPHKLNLSKNAIAERYHIPPEAMPHRAMNGVDHLLLCYRTAIGIA